MNGDRSGLGMMGAKSKHDGARGIWSGEKKRRDGGKAVEMGLEAAKLERTRSSVQCERERVENVWERGSPKRTAVGERKREREESSCFRQETRRATRGQVWESHDRTRVCGRRLRGSAGRGERPIEARESLYSVKSMEVQGRERDRDGREEGRIKRVSETEGAKVVRREGKSPDVALRPRRARRRNLKESVTPL